MSSPHFQVQVTFGSVRRVSDSVGVVTTRANVVSGRELQQHDRREKAGGTRGSG